MLLHEFVWRVASSRIEQSVLHLQAVGRLECRIAFASIQGARVNRHQELLEHLSAYHYTWIWMIFESDDLLEKL